MASSMICGTAFAAMAAAQSAHAQAAAPAAAPDQVQEIVVTGSLIRSPNITSDSPLTEVTHAEVGLTDRKSVV